MRHLFVGGTALILVLLCAAPAAAERTAVRQRAGTPAVLVDGTRVWAGDRGERVITDVSWSRAGDAIAFATLGKRGLSLVVVLVGGDTHGHVMRWPVPPRARVRRRAPAVTWLGRRRVALGPSELKPAVVASWRVRH